MRKLEAFEVIFEWTLMKILDKCRNHLIVRILYKNYVFHQPIIACSQLFLKNKSCNRGVSLLSSFENIPFLFLSLSTWRDPNKRKFGMKTERQSKLITSRRISIDRWRTVTPTWNTNKKFSSNTIKFLKLLLKKKLPNTKKRIIIKLFPNVYSPYSRN